MAQANINDMWMRATSTAAAQQFVQILDATGARDASVVVTLKTVEFSAAATATLEATVQAGDDGGNWFPLSATTPDVSIAIVATGAGRVVGEPKHKPLGSPKGWRWLRVQYDLSVTTGTVDAVISATLNANL